MKGNLIAEKLKTEEYSFLWENENLGKNIILLTTGGSHAYGTNVGSSDIDIRGICIEDRRVYWGLSNFEQFDDKATDTVIYGLRKIVNLVLNCNPNVLEMFGTLPEHQFILTKEGELLKSNIKIFLSRKTYQAFGGYATAQLRRLQNALARDSYPQKEKEGHILGSIQGQFNHFQENYQKLTGEDLKLYLDKSDKKDFEEEIFVDLNLKHYPLRDLRSMFADMSNVIKNYETLNHRNSKKDELHLNKHAMHLIRLLIMGIEILEGKGINTYRSKDRDFLLKIRNGDFSYEEIFKMVDELETKFKYAAQNTDLPERPDYEKVEEIMVEIYQNMANK
ncbi:MAG: nucleotidyltransferase domain-containing protein [Bacillota bacterium]|nr:nucleotidyltransferase domain-containing protein [Bacillota bacterium]